MNFQFTISNFKSNQNVSKYFSKIFSYQNLIIKNSIKIYNLKFKIEKGISLPELLISISLFGVVSILFVTIVMTNSRIFSDQKTNIHIASQNRLALDEITNQIRESAAVVDNCTVCGSDNTSNSLILILELWPIDADGNPFNPTGTGSDYVVYKKDTNSTNLIKKTFVTLGNGSSRQNSTDILATGVTNLLFAYDTNPPATNEVSIDLTTEGSSIRKTLSVRQTTKAILRNKASP